MVGTQFYGGKGFVGILLHFQLLQFGHIKTMASVFIGNAEILLHCLYFCMETEAFPVCQTLADSDMAM